MLLNYTNSKGVHVLSLNADVLIAPYFSHFSVQIVMFLGELTDILIYYVCWGKYIMVEEQLCYLVAWDFIIAMLIW